VTFETLGTFSGVAIPPDILETFVDPVAIAPRETHGFILLDIVEKMGTSQRR
jgi:hypothetical protein